MTFNSSRMAPNICCVAVDGELSTSTVTSLTTSAFLDMVAKCAVRELGDGTEAPLPTQPTCAIVAATC